MNPTDLVTEAKKKKSTAFGNAIILKEDDDMT